MSQPPENWFDLDDFAVYGLGRSGRAAANLLAACGKHVVASDTRQRADFDGELQEVDDRVRRVFGRNDHAGADAVVLSPGVRPGSETFERLSDVDCWVLSEIDLAYDACRFDEIGARFIAITGTDGKTTTTELCGALLEAAGRDVVVAGNIGTPLSAVVLDEPEWIVAEVSAFQLWSSRHFSPEVSGLTNIAGDHLDYFDDWSTYVEAKRRLLELTDTAGTVVLNADDEHLARWMGRARPRAVGAYKVGDQPEGVDLAVWSSDDAIWWSEGDEVGATVSQSDPTNHQLMELEAWSLPGRHNLQNAMCAAGMAIAAGVEADAIEQGLSGFEGLPHRAEWGRTWRGIDIYNDSKATNVQSALAGLHSFEAPYVAIVGGVDKGLELEALAEELLNRGAAVVLIGEMADRLEEVLGDVQAGARGAGELQIDRVQTMEQAVTRAAELAEQTSAASIALSPAASSFDMFDSYEHRGEVFRASVASLSDSIAG
jgi:UDP-N-acetylmuramoylalanine--D-glutamate ligase